MFYSRHTLFFVLALSAAALCSCDDDTASMGIYDGNDGISSATESFNITSRTVELGRVVASTSKSYLGLVRDPETGCDIKAEFLAQFHTFENYTLPDRSLLVKDDDGLVVADSSEIRLYFTDYFGDADNPMKLAVYELDRNNVMREDWTYYSDLSTTDYIPADAQPIATKVFTVEDYTLDDSERTSSSHYKNVRIILPTEYGSNILRAAVETPQYFTDSWQFMRHVCPGFAFTLQSGRGTMLTLDVGAMNIFFRYADAEKDTIYDGIARFAATPEVIQTTSIKNSDLASLVSDSQPYTWLKSPAGLATELTLPVDEVYAGHENDSISQARVIITRYNSSVQTEYALDAPSSVLLVEKDEMDEFFEQRKVADAKTAYTTALSTSYNTYTFSNISRMLSHLHHKKLTGMAEEGLTAAQWEAAHPDWNKAVLVPVVVKTVTNQSTGAVSQISVTHDFSLSSTRLVGGTKPISLDIIYSHYSTAE